MQQHLTQKDSSSLLKLTNVSVQFELDKPTPILQDIQFSLNTGRTLCLVGESGCGKSITALTILRLLPEFGHIISGSIFFNGEDLTQLSEATIRKKRGKDIGMIFQEPMTSLNPVLCIGDQVAEPLIQHLNFSKTDARDKAIELLGRVGIPSPQKRLLDYPHQLSGGLRQRVMIAMALACDPLLLLADEPTTALDVTIQGQLLTLLKDLAHQQGMGMILITHNLGVVAEMANDVCVMYAGKIVEHSSVVDLFTEPAHPYTQALMRAVPSLNEKKEIRLQSIPGVVPSPGDLPIGCSFRPRCPSAHDRCIQPPSCTQLNDNHSVSCWLYT